MSESDDMLSSVDSTESVSSREESQGETSDEMEVVGQVQPYADGPLAHIRPYKRRWRRNHKRGRGPQVFCQQFYETDSKEKFP